MRLLLIFSTIFIFLASFIHAANAKVRYSETNIKEQRLIREERKKRLREYEKIEAQKDIDRALKKKRSALWKKEQAKLTKEYRQERADRLAQIEVEREKEIASRARQKEIRAQMEIDESEYKSELVNRKMEILYGKDETDELTEEELADKETKENKPFWEKVLDFKK